MTRTQSFVDVPLTSGIDSRLQYLYKWVLILVSLERRQIRTYAPAMPPLSYRARLYCHSNAAYTGVPAHINLDVCVRRCRAARK